MDDTLVTVVGNLTGDPELKFTPSGAAVANFTVASTPRSFDKEQNEFVDGETLFMRCTAWRAQAENVAESLRRGYRCIVTGRLTQRKYTTNAGEERVSVELQVSEIGPSLKFVTASINKANREGGGKQPAKAGDDPWATPVEDPPPF